MSYFITTNILSSNNTGTTTLHTASADFIPLQLKTANDVNLAFDQSKIIYDDGYTIYKSTALTDIKDVKRNNDSLIWLTASKTYSDIFLSNTEIVGANQYLDVFGFTYAYIRGNPPQSVDLLYFGLNGNELVADTTESAVIAKLTRTDNGLTYITFNDLYLTVDLSDYSVSVQDSITTDTNFVQEFTIDDFDSLVNVCIYFNDTNGPRYIGITDEREIVGYGISNGSRYSATSLQLGTDTNKGSNYTLQLYNPKLIQFGFGTELDLSCSWVHYYNELNDKTNLQNVNINPDKTVRAVPVNHLLISPYHASINVKEQTIDMNHMPLKNMMTPEQKYISTPFSSETGQVLEDPDSPISVKRREYQKIFAGDKDETGYDKLLLTYTSNTKLQSLLAQDGNYFHYPFEAPQLPLSAAGLIEAGAVPGSTPFNSDRIFKKNAKYEDYIYWGRSQAVFGCDDGVWLCAWLSGSQGSSLSGMENSVWVDRWYDPSQLSVEQALETGVTTFTVTNNNPAVYDEPSTMTFDPGVYYKYDRVSNSRLNFITNTYNPNKTELRLHYKNSWDNIVEDQSSYNNDGSVINFDSSNIISDGPAYGMLEQTSLNLTNGSYVDIPYSDSLNLSGSFTIASWVRSDNWTDNPGSSIFATGFRGGISLNYDKHFFNPTVSVVENAYAHIIQYSLCNPIADGVIPSEVAYRTLDEVAVDLECGEIIAPPTTTTTTPTPTPTTTTGTITTTTLPPSPIDINTEINIVIDNSGSMPDAKAGLTTMKTTILKDCIQKYYNNDPDEYDKKVRIYNAPVAGSTSSSGLKGERQLQWHEHLTARLPETTKVINLTFGDEMEPYNAGNQPYNNPTSAAAKHWHLKSPENRINSTFEDDVKDLQDLLAAPGGIIYKNIIFHVKYFGPGGWTLSAWDPFGAYPVQAGWLTLLSAVETGDVYNDPTDTQFLTGDTNFFTEIALSSIAIEYEIENTNDPDYYLGIIVDTLNTIEDIDLDCS